MQSQTLQSPASNRQSIDPDRYRRADAEFPEDLNLIEAQRAGAIIDVDIDGVAGRYQSVILQVNPHTGSILIDELFPAGFIGLPGQSLTITVRRLDGSRTGFTTRVVERRNDDGVDNYLLMLPSSVAYEQRREVFRLRLARSRGVVAEFQTEDQQFCGAIVQDLSATGIRLELQNSIYLASGDVLTGLEFEFEQHYFQCQARVRHVSYDRAGKIIIGAAFHNFPRLQQRILERIIMQQQRRAVQQLRAAKNPPLRA
jgi:c-di-GMP-binding flagellar brake protein YcgR